jgi:hypothetical protein
LAGTLELFDGRTEVEQRYHPTSDRHRLAQVTRGAVIKIGFLVEHDAVATRAFDGDEAAANFRDYQLRIAL